MATRKLACKVCKLDDHYVDPKTKLCNICVVSVELANPTVFEEDDGGPVVVPDEEG